MYIYLLVFKPLDIYSIYLKSLPESLLKGLFLIRTEKTKCKPICLENIFSEKKKCPLFMGMCFMSKEILKFS